MPATRRNFLLLCTLAGSALATGQSPKHGGMPQPPPPADPQQPDKTPSGPDPQSVLRARFERNERDFRAGVDRLCQLAESLRDEVQATHTSEVLSRRMYKRVEDIEKLAKQLKAKA